MNVNCGSIQNQVQLGSSLLSKQPFLLGWKFGGIWLAVCGGSAWQWAQFQLCTQVRVSRHHPAPSAKYRAFTSAQEHELYIPPWSPPPSEQSLQIFPL